MDELLNSFIRALQSRFPAMLRIVSLASRFLLIFFLARFLSPEEVGLYGLLVVLSGYAVLALGFDFYTYVTREIIREPSSRWRGMLRSQTAFALTSYGFGYPAIILVFVFGLLPWQMFWWFLILIPLEHIGLELDRVLIAMHDQFGASIGLFLRQATTSLVLVPTMFVWPELRSLEIVLSVWLVFDVIGISVALALLRKHLRSSDRARVDWEWIRAGMKIALPFLLGTLCLRAMFTADRQLVATFEGLEILGAYTLFMTIAAGITQVMSAGVHQFLYPRLVADAHSRDKPAFIRTLRALAIQTVVVVVGIAGTVLVFQPLLLAFVSDPVYKDYVWILPWCLLVTGVYNLSLIPHFGLYALNRDRVILSTTTAAFAIFVVVIVATIGSGALLAVLLALGISSLLLFISKSVVLTIALRRARWK